MEATRSSSATRACCIRCGERLPIVGRPLLGEVVRCEKCQAQLEVVDVDPLVIGPVAKIEEDPEDFESAP